MHGDSIAITRTCTTNLEFGKRFKKIVMKT